jgi:14-3-3 protein epsilon
MSTTLEIDSNLSADDLSFLARSTHDIGRYPDAIRILNQLIVQKPALDRNEWLLFGPIYKSAVDQIRTSLRALTLASLSERNAPDLPDRINQTVQQSIEKLVQLCSSAITVIDTSLLPAATTHQARVFYFKVKGDMNRYIAEYKSDTNAKELASEAYSEAIRIADENLKDSDPVKLGTILNFSVFTHEHLGNEETAIELLKAALDRVQRDTSQLSDQSKRDSISVLSVMQANLAHWQGDDDFEEEEEEDEEN